MSDPNYVEPVSVIRDENGDGLEDVDPDFVVSTVDQDEVDPDGDDDDYEDDGPENLDLNDDDIDTGSVDTDVAVDGDGNNG